MTRHLLAALAVCLIASSSVTPAHAAVPSPECLVTVPARGAARTCEVEFNFTPPYPSQLRPWIHASNHDALGTGSVFVSWMRYTDFDNQLIPIAEWECNIAGPEVVANQYSSCESRGMLPIVFLSGRHVWRVTARATACLPDPNACTMHAQLRFV
jgi:hypothetical protein